MEKSENEALAQVLKEQYECLKASKEQDEKELKEQIQKLKA